jgi:bacterioferritin-associated ferredoxin
MYVCICNKVTEKDILHVRATGVNSLEDLQQHINVGTCCGRCKDCANRLLSCEKQDGREAA